MSEHRFEATGCLGVFLFLFVMGGSALGWLWFFVDVLGGWLR